MVNYDYTFKILVLGDDSAGRTSFTQRYCYNIFRPLERLTIGVDFHVKTIRLLDRTIKLQKWDVVGEERFRFLLPTYCLGSNAAIIMYDITNSNSLNDLLEYIQMIRGKAGNIPIALIGSKLHLEEFRAVSREEGISLARRYNLSAFGEISSETGQNVEQVFETIAEMAIERLSDRIDVLEPIAISNLGPILKSSDRKIQPKFKVFKINRYLELMLEYGKTNIYVGGRLFRQCKYLMLNIPSDNIREYNNIESIDEAAEKLDSSMERAGRHKYNISPETEFWGHCSNIQAWYENDYDTRILHRNLAFPLLNALVKVGDPLAKKVFKEEIARRLESGYPSVVMYLINQGYLKYLNQEELDSILENPKFKKNLSKWFNNSRVIPKWLSEKIKAKLKN